MINHTSRWTGVREKRPKQNQQKDGGGLEEKEATEEEKEAALDNWVEIHGSAIPLSSLFYRFIFIVILYIYKCIYFIYINFIKYI